MKGPLSLCFVVLGLFLYVQANTLSAGYVDLGLDIGEEERNVEPRNPESLKRYFKRETVTYENGGVSEIFYNVTVKSNLYVLEKMSSIVDVQCASDSLTITLSDKKETKFWREGTIIVGGFNWGCINDDGIVDVFYRAIEDIEWTEDNVVFLQTRRLQFHELFASGSIKFKFDPEAVNYHATKRASWTVQKTFGINHNPVQPIRIFGLGKQFSGGSFSFEVVCTRCFAQVNVGIEFQLDIKRKWFVIPYVDVFKLRVFGGYEAAIEIEATANFAANYQIERDLIPRKNFPGFGGSIAGIPFSINPFMSLKARAYLNAQATGTFSLKLGTKRFWEAGTIYTKSSGKFNQIVPQNIRENNFVPNPTFSYSGALDARVTLIPELGLNIFVVPVSGSLEPYLGVEANFGQGSCTPNWIPFYSVYGGVDWQFKVDVIRINLLVTTITFGQSFGLPYVKRGTIISKVRLPCSLCSGCLFVKKSSTQGSVTSQNSVTCPGGGSILDGFGGGRCFPNGTTASSNFEGYCNLVPCVVPCETYSDCGNCLLDPRCEWCNDPLGKFCYEPNQNSTVLDTENGTVGFVGACSADNVFVSQCTNETRFSNLAITPNPAISGPVGAVENVTVTWNGGELIPPTKVEVYLYVVNKWILIASGSRPLPSFALPNLPTRSDYRIRLFSLDDPTNVIDTANFTINAYGDCANGTIECTSWLASDWEECSVECGGGTQTRSIQCISSKDGIVDNNKCTGTPPSPSRACNSAPCFDSPLALITPVAGDVIPSGSSVNITWTGGQKDNTVALSYRTTSSAIWQTIAASAPNTGLYSWTLTGLLSFSTYQIRAVSGANITNQDVSNAFVVTAPKQYEIVIEASEAFSSSISVTIIGTYNSYTEVFPSLVAGKNSVTRNILTLGATRLLSIISSAGIAKIRGATVTYTGDDGATINARFGSINVNSDANYTLSDCSSFSSCYDCLAFGTGCGWCDVITACLPGNSVETVLDGVCTNWVFTLPTANDTCTGRVFTPTGALVPKVTPVPAATGVSSQLILPIFSLLLALLSFL